MALGFLLMCVFPLHRAGVFTVMLQPNLSPIPMLRGTKGPLEIWTFNDEEKEQCYFREILKGSLCINEARELISILYLRSHDCTKWVPFPQGHCCQYSALPGRVLSYSRQLWQRDLGLEGGEQGSKPTLSLPWQTVGHLQTSLSLYCPICSLRRFLRGSLRAFPWTTHQDALIAVLSPGSLTIQISWGTLIPSTGCELWAVNLKLIIQLNKLKFYLNKLKSN